MCWSLLVARRILPERDKHGMMSAQQIHQDCMIATSHVDYFADKQHCIRINFCLQNLSLPVQCIKRVIQKACQRL